MTTISPPKIHGPIYAGAEIVGVLGWAGCEVSIYASGARIGTGRMSAIGWGPIRLDRPLQQGEVVTATQSKAGDTSQPTWPEHSVAVVQIPAERLLGAEQFKPPMVETPLYECQQGFAVTGLIEGVRVTEEIVNPAFPTTGPSTPYKNVFVRVPTPTGLEPGQEVRASQAFPSLAFPVPSAQSDKGIVLPAPPLDDEKYRPVVITDYDGDGDDDVSIGATALKVCNTLPGATVRIFGTDPRTDREIEFGRGVVAGGCSIVLTEPLTSLQIRAQQWLCENRPRSPVSVSFRPKTAMAPVQLHEPICDGAIEVKVTGAEIGATIEIEVTAPRGRGFVQRGVGTAAETDCSVTIGGGVALQAGQQVRARQCNTKLTSPWTKPVTVSGPGSQPQFSVLDGISHASLPGVPVFSRGTIGSGGFGPRFELVLCGATRAMVRIIDPKGESTLDIKLTETMKGHFSGGWDWTWPSWTTKQDIAIGLYRARFVVTVGTRTIERELTFFVAFDDDEIRQEVVSATAAFSGVFPSGGQSWEDGTALSEGEVNSFFTSGPPQIVDCLGAARIIMARGLIMTLSAGEFDQVGYTTSSMHLERRTVPTATQLDLADWAYIRNDLRYLKKHPGGGYQGENVIKVGTDLFYGFPGGNKSYAGWVQTLISAYNSGLPSEEHITTIPGFLSDHVYFFDAVSVSIDIAKVRNP